MAATLAPEQHARLRSTDVDIPGLYLALLDRAAAWLPTLVRVAAHQPGPVLVHCNAGKDRTGVAVAVLLAGAGAPRAHIVEDYLRSNQALHAIRTRMRLAHPSRPEAPEGALGAPVEAIEAVLDRLGPDPAAFLAGCGVPAAALRRWRHRAWPTPR